MTLCPFLSNGWSSQLLRGRPLTLRIDHAARLFISVGQKQMRLARIRLNLYGLLQIVESAQRIALQGEYSAAQQVGAVMIGAETESAVQLGHGVGNAFDASVDGG
jgi:hypothetical protein